MMKSVNKDEPELFRSLNSISKPYILLNEEEKVTAIIKVRRNVRDLMKHECRKDQRYSDYILELIQYKKEHQGYIKKEGL